MANAIASQERLELGTCKTSSVVGDNGFWDTMGGKDSSEFLNSDI